MENAITGDWQERLRDTIIGQYLERDPLARVSALAQPVELEVGDFLFREGEVQFQVFVMLEGQLDLVMQVPGRGCQRILTLGPGELVAWSSLLGEGVMSCSALCIRRAHLIAVDARTLQKWMDADHEFGFQFMRMMAHALSRRLTATRLQLLDLFASAPSQE
jgi:CRP/FNR family transcriptional regulator, cyclic AMP receptor protein